MKKKYFISIKDTVIEGYYDESTIYAAPTSAGYTTEELTEDESNYAKENFHNRFANGSTSFIHHHGFTEEERIATFKLIRDAILKKTDRLLLEDYPISVSERIEVLTYRQELRDSTISMELPIKPDFL